MSDIPLPETQASSLKINGSNSDWITPIEDCVHAYLVDQWNIDKPPKEYLKQNNRSYDGVGYAHFWVQRGQTNLNINLLMKRLDKGQLDPMLGNMMIEVRRALIEYQPHWIAGISYFDDFNEVPLVYGPDDERNPWQDTWVGMITVNAFYQVDTMFNHSSMDYNPAMYSAGSLTYK